MASLSKYCNLCGRPLRGVARVYQHPEQPDRRLTVCGHCRRLAPRCRRCGLPMRADMASGGICALCQAGAPHCLSCGSLITGRYIEIDGRGPYCETCYQTHQHCDVCGVPLDASVQRLPDGRAICGVCQQTAIVDAGQAKSLFDQTISIIQNTLGLSLHIGVRFVVTDRIGLRAQVEKMQPGLAHEADRVLGVYVRNGRHRTIYVQNGLPRILLAQVIAHEWGHAWKMENCPLVRNILIVEGFAEWLAYKVLQAMGAVKKMALMTARRDLYGEGLRLMLSRETREGVSGVVALCTTGEVPTRSPQVQPPPPVYPTVPPPTMPSSPVQPTVTPPQQMQQDLGRMWMGVRDVIPPTAPTPQVQPPSPSVPPPGPQPPVRYCRMCGTPNRIGARFCVKCGKLIV